MNLYSIQVTKNYIFMGPVRCLINQVSVNVSEFYEMFKENISIKHMSLESKNGTYHKDNRYHI